MPIPRDRDAAGGCYHKADSRQLHGRGSECRFRMDAKSLISDSSMRYCSVGILCSEFSQNERSTNLDLHLHVHNISK